MYLIIMYHVKILRKQLCKNINLKLLVKRLVKTENNLRILCTGAQIRKIDFEVAFLALYTCVFFEIFVQLP